MERGDNIERIERGVKGIPACRSGCKGKGRKEANRILIYCYKH